jgi:hypothetical protein
MAGINRAIVTNENLSKSRLYSQVKCVFISHQKGDSAKCEKIAEYIMEANIDVYFDEYDTDLKIHRQTNNAKGVVNSIRKGIDNSTHMLCVISPNTLGSKWVPWELGYGYAKTTIGVLTLKGINESELPDYIKTVQIVRGTKSLNQFIVELTGLPQLILEDRNFSKAYNFGNHPLNDILDWQL